MLGTHMHITFDVYQLLLRFTATQSIFDQFRTFSFFFPLYLFFSMFFFPVTFFLTFESIACKSHRTRRARRGLKSKCSFWPVCRVCHSFDVHLDLCVYVFTSISASHHFLVRLAPVHSLHLSVCSFPITTECCLSTIVSCSVSGLLLLSSVVVLASSRQCLSFDRSLSSYQIARFLFARQLKFHFLGLPFCSLLVFLCRSLVNRSPFMSSSLFFTCLLSVTILTHICTVRHRPFWRDFRFFFNFWFPVAFA